jgi:hypothetical protein
MQKGGTTAREHRPEGFALSGASAGYNLWDVHMQCLLDILRKHAFELFLGD